MQKAKRWSLIGLFLLLVFVFESSVPAFAATRAVLKQTSLKSTSTKCAYKATAKKKVATKKKATAKKKVTKKYKKKRSRARRVPVSRGHTRTEVEQIVRQVGAIYWPDKAQLDALVWIQQRECNRPGVVSAAGYHGLFQLGNPPEWMVLGDAASETRAGMEYIKRRYGTPLKAKAFKAKRGWY